MNDVEMLHIANVDIDAADVIEGTTRLLHRRFHILAHLARLDLDIAETGNRAVWHARRHARNEDQLALRGDRGRLGKMAVRLAKFAGGNLLFHGALVFSILKGARQRRYQRLCRSWSGYQRSDGSA